MAGKGASVATIGAGVLCVFGAIKGISPLKALGAIIKGSSPSKATQAYPISQGTVTASASTSTATTTTTSDIANDALQYEGDKYVWGASGPNTFDCSGLVNWVLNHDLGMAIPGYTLGTHYSGHGPVTEQYYVWAGATTIPEGEMQAGDLVCWLTHIGIALSSTEMISALDPTYGVYVSTVQGGAPIGEPVKIRRITATTSPPTAATPGTNNHNYIS